MVKNYYKNEYSPKQWAALIDKAHEFGCMVEFSKYGNIVTINSTSKESVMMQTSGTRQYWADVIHGLIADAAKIRWAVYTEGVAKPRAWFNSKQSAEQYRKDCEYYDNTPHKVVCNF